MTALLAGLVLVLFLQPLTACGGGGKLVGAVLQPLREQVNAIIDEASRQGQILLLTAAGQVDLAISNAESAFAADLDRGIDKVDDATRRNVQALQALVQNLQVGSAQLLQTTIDGSQQLINSLPFANKNPQVRSYGPRFVAAGQPGTVEVDVRGNFYWATLLQPKPTLLSGEDTYPAKQATTSELSFVLPSSLFQQPGSTLARASFTLTVPYQTGKVFKKIKPGVFELLITVLPPVAVTSGTLTTTAVVQGVQRQFHVVPANGLTGGGWTLNSWEDCDDHNDSHTFSATAGGWRIVPSSVQIGYTYRGSEDAGGASVDTVSTTGFAVSGHTVAHCTLNVSYGSGKITYYASYVEERSYTTPQTAVQPVAAMRWGDRLTFPVPRSAWQLRLTLWNGSVLSASGAVATNPYVTVTDNGTAVDVAVLSPGSLLASVDG